MGRLGIIRFGWVAPTGDHRTRRRRRHRRTQRRRGTIIAMITVRLLLIAPTRIIELIILGRGPRLLSTLRRTIRWHPIQHRLRIRLPSMQPHNMMHTKVRALSHLTNNLKWLLRFDA